MRAPSDIDMSDAVSPAAIASGAKMNIVEFANAEFNCPGDNV